MNNFFSRVITSFFLITILLISLFLYKNLFLFLLLIASVITFFEFNRLYKKIKKNKKKNFFFINFFTIFYLIIFVFTSYDLAKIETKILFILLICILSDIGGYIVGKTIGGKKLTKISPKKTISGSIGSFLFSLMSITIFSLLIANTNYIFNSNIVIYTLFISLISQIGDLFISYLKRKAKVKDTGTILPGHGGLLDRIDGILLAIPVAFILDKMFF